ncbi:2-oxoglutarate dehydrogenase, E2 component, dihydrolipoamide succinyltransferase [Nocardioides islandensis]|uniref:Dihydrolipoamide acetyltransferase component of pyruvate dehydrogenase complex n=1 Tax=Nocardioides islandensis TaxID=433663 RepID=A0A930VJM2_9ACTN|nr:2-oxoglutarate dehydrogenase, E2 component, dihydrolipoamide succinyltransferase [Nocardioides islandensis]MBF4765801.1 2-oxoglutarate dehydrogenase, E2 component, dihydrolipoamide succinyltransferase [Nocardioides islandensis]
MATEVTLPALGESVTEGTVTRWLKQVGDAVAVDEALLEVSTDKVDTEIPSPVAGTLLEIKASEDETVEVGAVLALIGQEGESAGSDSGGGSEADSAAEDEGDAQAEASAESGAESGAEQETPAGEDTQEQQPEQPEQPEQPAAEQEQPSSGGGGGSGKTTSVTLPALGESVTEGTVTRWLKQVGDAVAVDEALLEVSTDKVDTEIPSPVAGTLLEIKVNEDETVEVGAELAVIGEAGESAGAAPSGGDSGSDQSQREEAPAEEEKAEEEKAEEPAPAAEAEPEQPAAQAAEPAREEPAAPQAPAPQAPAAPAGRDESSGYVTPLVRKMATQHGVDLATVTGTGVGGRIRKQDVLDAAAQQGTTAAPPTAAAAAAASPAPAAPAAAAAAPAAPVAATGPAAPTASTAPATLRGTTEKMSRLRKVIATRMLESLQTSAQLTTVVEVDITSVSRLRDQVKADFAGREGVKLSFMPFFAKATIDALKEHPKLNAAIDTEKGEVTYYDRENIAIAVDTERGLLTPVIKDAGDLSIAGLARKIADVAERTRTNKITPDELSGGTFTLTNTGSRGALFDTPIINQPQVAVLGTGAVVKRAVVIDDPNLGETIAVRQMVYLALTYDHRLVDGADAARFLSDVKARLETGTFEV